MTSKSQHHSRMKSRNLLANRTVYWARLFTADENSSRVFYPYVSQMVENYNNSVEFKRDANIFSPKVPKSWSPPPMTVQVNKLGNVRMHSIWGSTVNYNNYKSKVEINKKCHKDNDKLRTQPSLNQRQNWIKYRK